MNNVIHLRIPVALLGRWRSDNEDGRSEYVISVEDGGLKVVGLDFVDGEQYVISGVDYDRGMVAFDTLMPSTGRRGHIVFKASTTPGQAQQIFTFTDTIQVSRQDADQ
jgi:hypothetical protein